MLDNLNTSVLVLGSNLDVLSINPAGEMLFATSARLATDHQFERLVVDSDHFIESLKRTMITRQAFTERESTITLHNLQTITIDCTVTTLEDNREGKLLLELTQVDRQLRIAREENLLTQSHTVRTLLRGMAHEIKNPLGGLRGAAQLLEKELPNDSLKEYTQVIIAEADRLQNLLDRMLGPNSPPRKHPLNIHSVLEHVYTLVLADTPDGVEIKRDYDPSIPEINADADQLIQAVLNLLRNAVQAVGERGQIIIRSRAQRQVTFGQKHHRLAIRIDIIDDGPGVPPMIEESLFYPMVTGRAEGTGLGLPIAQSLVNLHGGLIECNSSTQQTVFTIFLPLESL